MRMLPAFFPLLSSRQIAFTALALATVALVACDRSGELETTLPPDSPPATPAAKVPPAPPKRVIPTGPVLEIRETGTKIVISGTIASKYQGRDIVDGIRNTFPDAEVVNELGNDPEIPEVLWGNRVTELLLPLIEAAEDAHFRYEDGITLIEGTVEKKGHIASLGKLTVNVMEAPDSKGITNGLKVAEKP